VAADPPRVDDGTLASLFHEHNVELVRLAVLLVHDQQTAEDVVQDVFARLHARQASGRSGEELAYIRAAVLNACRSVLRHRIIVRRADLARDVLDERATASASAEAEAIRAEDRRQVLMALAALPDRRREVLVLRYYLGLSEAEIASTLGISQGTVKSATSRGIAALARALGEEP
jgi:RNA polymerase sigma-70 factor (sigma-E family)